MSKSGKGAAVDVHIREFDAEWIRQSFVNGPCRLRQAKRINATGVGHMASAAWVSAAAACCVIDAEDDMRGGCFEAQRSQLDDGVSRKGYVAQIGMVQGVLVQMAQVKDAQRLVHGGKTKVAVHTTAVTYAAALDSPMIDRLTKVEDAADTEADSIGVVASPHHCGACLWSELYHELVAMKDAAGDSQMLVILPSDELCTLTNISRAALCAMMAGASIIQPQAGATFEMSVAIILTVAAAVEDYHARTGVKVALSLAEQHTATEYLLDLSIVMDTLGQEWLTPDLLRIRGAGGLAELRAVWGQLGYDDE